MYVLVQLYVTNVIVCVYQKWYLHKMRLGKMSCN